MSFRPFITKHHNLISEATVKAFLYFAVMYASKDLQQQKANIIAALTALSGILDGAINYVKKMNKDKRTYASTVLAAAAAATGGVAINSAGNEGSESKTVILAATSGILLSLSAAAAPTPAVAPHPEPAPAAPTWKDQALSYAPEVILYGTIAYAAWLLKETNQRTTANITGMLTTAAGWLDLVLKAIVMGKIAINNPRTLFGLIALGAGIGAIKCSNLDGQEMTTTMLAATSGVFARMWGIFALDHHHKRNAGQEGQQPLIPAGPGLQA